MNGVATITAAALNALTVEQRIEVLRGPFGRQMHAWAGSYVTFFRWARQSSLTRSVSGTTIRNGSVFFIDIGGKLLAITAAHVYRGFLESKRRATRSICQIENIEFDPEARLISLGDKIDIATFDFTYDELRKVGKQALTVQAESWPPPHPFSGQAAYFAGFPGVSRLWTDWRTISFGLYIASSPIGTASDSQITCPFEREFWIDASGHGLPPQGFDLGGVSGGPVLLPMEEDGAWTFHLGGVISEAQASRDFETITATPAHFIAEDGRIREHSLPTRHAVRAEENAAGTNEAT